MNASDACSVRRLSPLVPGMVVSLRAECGTGTLTVAVSCVTACLRQRTRLHVATSLIIAGMQVSKALLLIHRQGLIS